LAASEKFYEFVTTYLKVVLDYLGQKISINLLTRVIRDNGCSPIGVFKEHVTALLPAVGSGY
jgi:hypothetical protein